MGEKILMKGAEAISEAAIRAGCRHFFGYPITPQNEAPAYMARRLPEVGGSFTQAESEVAAVNMLYGCAATGKRVITTSSSPGISLMTEGISYMAGADLPAVIVNVVRGGPGLGDIAPAQGDYFQAVKGGGHGDYHCIVVAPSTIQENVDLMKSAFDLADKYRTPTIVLSDGLLGQMMEAIELPEMTDPATLPHKDWAADGMQGKRGKNLINSFDLLPDGLEKMNIEMWKKFKNVEEDVMFEEVQMDDAEYVFVAYGTVARILKSVIKAMRANGHKVGLFRPITLWPFPSKRLAEIASRPQVKFLFDIELSFGQMIEDVKLAVSCQKEVKFYGRQGGMVPTTDELEAVTLKHIKGEPAPTGGIPWND
ncbi:MAG TPA: 3-methyl-2-oxobutanoate dehydrogenase subunit VorB [Caldisericia bacterium]|nr:3-methyl-2-oxobutanoate dehydrogenase subunit VorB [Caldisericia bacterium]HPF49377.1 3-methyl-2-oxobutanoate dehydrogenase subunit VorB [Caldisericia bacterium]HPI84453.1 3-methyl-2-oxobutanoate dehydrogenase subunit VorB [Caldisericia bacterium]HPQ93786.1 3-methyl-2-oxobutanoate dehydrogenase subunit VorB [Caldisericia bacterium]HRV75650.1 3-methyl-2-oxobutanoate dehydrogenase subunit VorB [Caldisericia bacterium]